MMLGRLLLKIAVFEGGAFSYQYGSWSAASDGFTAKGNTNKQIL
jgi:hypothetical protein